MPSGKYQQYFMRAEQPILIKKKLLNRIFQEQKHICFADTCI